MAYDAREGDLRMRLAARLRVCILGGTAFLNSESCDLVKAFHLFHLLSSLLSLLSELS